MTTPYDLLSLEAFIKVDTFYVTPSHCRFQVEDIVFLPPVTTLDVASIPTTEIIYWGELANYTPVLKYKVNIQNARLRKYRDKLQYNVDIGSLLILSKTLATSIEQDPLATETAINASICSLLEIQNIEILTRFDKMIKQGGLTDYADVLSAYPVVHHIVPRKKQLLFRHLLRTPGHVHAYCYLFHFGISVPFNDEADQTMRLADIIRKNPFLYMTSDYYGRFIGYEQLTYERLEDLAERNLGPITIAKDRTVQKARAVAAVIAILRNEEENGGHTWTSLETVQRLLCAKLKQPAWTIIDLLDKYEALRFLVSQRADQSDHTRPDIPLNENTILQRPETKQKEDDLLDWFVFLERKLRVRTRKIDESLLESVLAEIYKDGSPRDRDQIAAIRMGIEKPVCCISGPPGCVRAIVQYFERKFKEHYDIYTEQYSARLITDANNIEEELAEYVQRLRRNYRVVGDFDENDGGRNTFADRFDGLMDRTRNQATTENPKMHISNIYQMTSQKLYELKYKKYVRLQSSSDLSMAKLVAPSGVAARRLSDACDNHPTHTCCSLIGQLQEDNLKEDPGFKDFFPFKLLLVDEASMVDLEMVCQIMEVAEQEKVQLIFLGDPHQLPPIGIGQFFRDVLATKRLPHTALHRIYRQGVGSNIAAFSKAIVAGEDASIPLLQNFATHLALTDLTFGVSLIDTFFDNFNSHVASWDILNITLPLIEETTETPVPDWAPFVARIYRYLLKDQNYMINNVKILTPFREGNGGRYPLNNTLQEEMMQLRLERNEGKPIDQQYYLRFKTYDPVIHRKNIRRLNIYNGDIGFVLPHTTTGDMKALVVQYPHKQLFYTPSGNTKEEIAPLKDLELAYAMTCHSAQGSQFNYVIVVLPRFLNRFTTALMINTLISRAKTRLVIISTQGVLEECLRAKYDERRTRIRCDS